MAERNTTEGTRARRARLLGGALAAALTLAPAAVPAASGEAWDDSHMQSRQGGPRTSSLEATRIDGVNRFDPAAAGVAAEAAVAEQWLPASQHPWSRRARGLGNVPGSEQDARRPAIPSESRHNRNPASWSRSTQSSSLRAGAVRRSAGGR